MHLKRHFAAPLNQEILGSGVCNGTSGCHICMPTAALPFLWSPLIHGDITQNPWSVDWSSEIPLDEVSRSREAKPWLDYPSQGESLPCPGWKGSSVINLPPGGRCVFSGDSVSGWQAWQSAVATTRSALANESSGCWAPCMAFFLSPWLFHSCTQGARAQEADDRGWLMSAEQVIIYPWLISATLVVDALWYPLTCKNKSL